MSKGRKPLEAVAITGDVYDADTLAQRHQQLAAMNEHQQALVDEYGDGLPWHPDHYEAAIRIEIGRSAESFLRAGRLLLVARECAEHGEWIGMLNRINLGRDSAERMMMWARQISGAANAARVRHLQDAASTIGKMIELSRLPDDQFRALAEEGRTGELDLDDVASMTRDELRAAVREARADASAKDERIGKLSDDVNKAEEKAAKALRKWKAASPDEQQVQLEQRLVEAKLTVISDIGSEKYGLTAAMLALAEHCNAHGLDCAQAMGSTLDELIAAVRRVRDNVEYGFAVSLAIDAKA